MSNKNTLYNISLLFIGCVSAVFADTYHSSFSPYDTSWRIAFTAHAKGDAYLTGGPALEIIQFICNGKEVTPRVIEGVVDPNYRSYKCAVENVTYVYIPSRVIVIDRSDGPTKMRSLLYVLDINSVNILIIRYRIHYPDGGVSEENTLVMENVSRACHSQSTGAINESTYKPAKAR